MPNKKHQFYTGDGTPFTTSVSTTRSDNSPNPDYVYLDMALINHQTTKTQFDKSQPYCEFFEQNNQPIIEEPGDYKLAVTKFSLDGVTNSLPVFRFLTQDSSTTQGIYSVTIEGTDGNNTSISQIYVDYGNPPSRADLTLPGDPEDTGNEVYYIYSIQQVINLFNSALYDAFKDVSEGLGSQQNPLLKLDKAPFVWFNPDTEKLEIYAPLEFGDANRTSNSFKLYFNQPTLDTIADVPYKYHTDLNQGRIYEIIFTSNRYRNVLFDMKYTYNSGYQKSPFYRIIQEYPSLGKYWSPISSIAVELNSGLNVYPTVQTPPLNFGQSNYGNLKQDVKDHKENIITEFLIDKTNPRSWDQNLLFTANNYTFTAIAEGNHKPLRELKITFYYRERLTSRLIPLYLNSQATAHLGLIFQKSTIEER